MIKMFENNISQLVRYVALMSVVVLATCTPNSELATVDNQPSSSSEQALALVAPELVGMDSSRLNRVTQAMQGFVDEGKLAGVVTMAARDNKIVHFESVGYRDLEAQAPITNDALFRIYSMTKPVTGVALMILYEEGKFRLADPVEKYLPEFENLQVFAQETKPVDFHLSTFPNLETLLKNPSSEKILLKKNLYKLDREI